MDKKKSKYFTIMIIPHSEKKPVSLNIPVNIFKALSIALIVLSFVSIVFIKQYYDYKEAAIYAQRSIVENKSLSKDFAQVARDAIELREAIARIEKLEEDIRRTNEFDPTKSYFSQQNVQALKAPSAGDEDNKAKVTASSTLAAEAVEAVQLMKTVLPEREESLQEVQTMLQERHSELAAIPSIWPTNGRMMSGFGYRRDPFTGRSAFHTGIDIANRTGTPVYAAADARVVYAKYEGGYGRTILLNHGNGVSTVYAHLSRYAIQQGDTVRKGQLIGYIGATGRVTGAHLHYEVLENGKFVDPYKYF